MVWRRMGTEKRSVSGFVRVRTRSVDVHYEQTLLEAERIVRSSAACTEVY